MRTVSCNPLPNNLPGAVAAGTAAHVGVWAAPGGLGYLPLAGALPAQFQLAGEAGMDRAGSGPELPQCAGADNPDRTRRAGINTFQRCRAADGCPVLLVL